jgi:hypothetical protein
MEKLASVKDFILANLLFVKVKNSLQIKKREAI